MVLESYIYMKPDQQLSILLDTLKHLLNEGNAHASFEAAVADLPLEHLTIKPELLPYSIWQLVEHIRIAQWDIFEFCNNPSHESPKWPEGYWVDGKQSVTAEQWSQSLAQIREDREKFLALMEDPETDLFTRLPQGTGQTILKEALVIADHNAYHIGEIIVIRRLLGNWKS
jgi:uncharacterized damage-inducible protein DinB